MYNNNIRPVFSVIEGYRHRNKHLKFHSLLYYSLKEISKIYNVKTRIVIRRFVTKFS